MLKKRKYTVELNVLQLSQKTSVRSTVARDRSTVMILEYIRIQIRILDSFSRIVYINSILQSLKLGIPPELYAF